MSRGLPGGVEYVTTTGTLALPEAAYRATGIIVAYSRWQ
jgi:hypothetical protein